MRGEPGVAGPQPDDDASSKAGIGGAVLAGVLDAGLTPALLELALTHRSYAYEHGGLPTNERLEFLGDAVLGLVVTDEIYRRHADLAEGQLAKIRASVVNMRALAGVGRDLGLGEHLRLGRGEESTGGRDKASILADTVEALIGATWLTGGLAAAGPFVHRLLDPLLTVAAELGAALDWKTSVQELAAERGLGSPEYTVVGVGPDHAKVFRAEVLLAGRVRGNGEGPSKKEAEQRAAEAAWLDLTATGPDIDPDPDPDPAADSDRDTDTDTGEGAAP